LDIVVFGRACAKRCAATMQPGARHKPLPQDVAEMGLDRFDRLRHASGSTPTADLRLRMQRTMQEHAAVFRTGETLAEGVDKIGKVFDAFADVRVSDRSMIWNSDLVE